MYFHISSVSPKLVFLHCLGLLFFDSFFHGCNKFSYKEVNYWQVIYDVEHRIKREWNNLEGINTPYIIPSYFVSKVSIIVIKAKTIPF